MNNGSNTKHGEIHEIKSSEISASTAISSATNAIYEATYFTLGSQIPYCNSQFSYSCSEADATPTYTILDSSDTRMQIRIDQRAGCCRTADPSAFVKGRIP